MDKKHNDSPLPFFWPWRLVAWRKGSNWANNKAKEALNLNSFGCVLLLMMMMMMMMMMMLLLLLWLYLVYLVYLYDLKLKA